MTRFLLPALALAAFALPTLAHAGDAAAGKATYETNCSSCHGATGKGDGPVGAALPPQMKPRDFSVGEFKFDTDGDGETGTDADIKNVLANGGAKYGGNPLMAPWPQVQGDDLENIIAYGRSLKQ